MWGVAASIWVVLAVLGGIFDGLQVDDASQTDLNIVLSMKVFNTDNRFSIPLPSVEFWKSLGDLMTFNFNMFDGSDYQYIRWLLVAAFSMPIFIVLMQMIVPAALSSLGFVRRIFP